MRTRDSECHRHEGTRDLKYIPHSLSPEEVLLSLTGCKPSKKEELAGVKKGKDSGSNGALVEPTPPVDDAAGGEDQQVRCSLYPSGPEV